MAQSVFMHFVAFLSKAVNRYEKTNTPETEIPRLAAVSFKTTEFTISRPVCQVFLTISSVSPLC